MSLVQTAPASPYRVSLASRTASSSVSNGSTASTGPNTSSQATVIRGVTPVSTVRCPRRPLAGRGIEEREHLAVLRLGGQRPHLGGRVGWVAELDGLRPGHD